MFVLKNVNPSQRKTDDSLVRALSLALNITYVEAYKSLAEFGMGQSLSMTDVRTLRGFLRMLGYNEKILNRNCNVDVFTRQYAKPNSIYLLRIGKSVTVCINRTIYDNYNPKSKIVTSYWRIS